MQVISSAGLSWAEELLLSQGDPVGPSVQRSLQAEEDLGRCEQVGWLKPKATTYLYGYVYIVFYVTVIQ